MLASLACLACLMGAHIVAASRPSPNPPHIQLALALVAGTLLGMTSTRGQGQRISVAVESDLGGTPRGFVLSLGSEQTRLEHGRTWTQLDHFKWVTRGIIESPQSFAVHPDGTVDLNGETFHPGSPEAALALEDQINRRHAATVAAPTRTAPSATHQGPASNRVEYQVRLDPLGHFLVSARRGSEKVETGARGLEHLIIDGWMLRPKHFHLDPLQRHLEIDDARFECTPEGAAQLAALLNERYAPAPGTFASAAIEIRENAAAATGFDIHFWIVRAGTRFEIKGHLGQDKLDILQDHDRCDLLNPQVILRLSPPFLYLRRRRPDGGEESIPGLPDIKYRSITAAELQRILNHPLIRRDGGGPEIPVVPTEPIAPPSPAPAPPVLRPNPPPATPISDAPPAKKPPPQANPVAIPQNPPPPRVFASEIERLFANKSPGEVNQGIFRRLTERLSVPVQDVRLSLPRVFEDRRFEILDFNGTEITSVLQLRSEDFYGFYLTHLGPARIDFVYACHGTHIEWGIDRCVVQSTAGAETAEFHADALVGLAQNAANHFVFLVEPAYKAWIKSREADCAAAYAHFLDLTEWARRREEFPLIWPV
ncbi:MAG: hypothetical protein IT581_23380 [Verrucomicrobiales bacterium]|nr:hypothetical protein [Verrucomicrobiales bacterium]